MPPCTGSRVNTNYEWIASWGGCHCWLPGDPRILETPLATHCCSQRLDNSVMTHPSKMDWHQHVDGFKLTWYYWKYVFVSSIASPYFQTNMGAKYEATAMASTDGENVPFIGPTTLDGPVEVSDELWEIFWVITVRRIIKNNLYMQQNFPWHVVGFKNMWPELCHSLSQGVPALTTLHTKDT